MQKKTISLALCLAMLVSMFAFAVPVNAATVDSAPTAKATTVESPSDFSWDNANVYFLLTDRFYNGNTSNDHSYGRTLDASGKALSGWNTAPGTFHGGDFAGVTKKINEGYFDDLGVNAIWISAPYEQIHGYVDSGDDTNHVAHYSYHGYYVLDYTETDANFGTKAEFKTLVDTAHKHGIRVVMDIVMNHAGYNNIADMEEFNYGTITNKSAIDAYKYKLTDVSGFHNYIDYSTSSTDWGRWWGDGWIRSGLPGYHDDGGGDLTMSLAGLPDFRTESTATVSIPTFLQQKWQKEGTYSTKVAKYGSSGTVSDYLTTWLAEWVETYGVDGFRCDTAKHVELASWKKLKNKCVAALNTWRQNNPTAVGADWDEDFWMTGECWGHGVGKSPYYTEGGFDSMINFSITGALGANAGFPDAGSINNLYQNYASTINSDPSFNALTYMSSHDTNILRKDDNFYQGTALLLTPGAVQPFYGDETARPLVSGIPVEGGGHALRSDMNWGQNSALLTHWQKVGKFRANHVAVGAGDHQQITAYNSSTGYTFSRSYDDGETADGVICTIGAPKNTSISVDVSSMWGNGKTVTNEYDGTTATVTNGKATFNSGSQGVILISGPQSTINMSVKGEKYAFLDKQTVTVKLRGADYAMASVNGGTPFRVVDGQTFEIGDGIEVGTVFNVTLTATNATETLEKSFAFKKKDPNAITRIYFDNSKYNWSTVNVYIYDETADPVVSNAAWPGEAMTYDSATGLYVYEVPDELAANGLAMFNAGDGSANRYPGDGEKGLSINETDMLFSYGNKWTAYNGEKVDPTDPPKPGTTRTIYLDNSKFNFSNPTIYVWKNGTTESPVAWPGAAMKSEGGNIYSYTCSADYDCCIFSDNGGNQTGDITGIPYLSAKYDGSWTVFSDEQTTTQQPTTEQPTSQQPTTQQPTTQKPTEADTDTRTVYFDNSSANYTTPCIHVWSSVTGDAYKEWPGITMTKASGNLYVATFPAEYDKCVFSDNKNNQTGDLDIPYTNAKYSNGTWTEVQTAPGTKVLLGDVNGDGHINVKDVTEIQRHCAELKLLTGTTLAAADVNQDTKVTVKDATYVQAYISEMEGASAHCGETITVGGGDQPITEPTTAPAGSRTIYFDNSKFNASKPTIYVWKKGTEENMGAWPGVAMTAEGNNLYSYTCPEEYNCCIFTDGNGNKLCDDQDIPYTEAMYDGSWTNYDGANNPPATQPTTTPTPFGDSITLDASAIAVGDEAWYIWTWNNESDGVWIKGEGSASAVVFKGNFKSKMLVARVDANAAEPVWDSTIWNQTGDLDTKVGGTFVISGWGQHPYMNGDWK